MSVKLINSIMRNPSGFLRLMVDNNSASVRNVLSANGYDVEGYSDEAIKTLILSEWQSGKPMAFLLQVQYKKPGTPDVPYQWQPGVQPPPAPYGSQTSRSAQFYAGTVGQSTPSASRDAEGNLTWQDYVGAGLTAIVSLLGNNNMGGSQGYGTTPQPDNTMKYMMMGIGAIVVIAVVYIVIKKK